MSLPGRSRLLQSAKLFIVVLFRAHGWINIYNAWILVLASNQVLRDSPLFVRGLEKSYFWSEIRKCSHAVSMQAGWHDVVWQCKYSLDISLKWRLTYFRNILLFFKLVKRERYYNLCQKSLDRPQKKAVPASPVSVLLQWMSDGDFSFSSLSNLQNNFW